MGFKRLFASSKMGARKWVVAVAALGFAGVVSAAAVAIPNLFPFLDPTGFVSTYNTTGPIQQNGAFFQSLGTNGRSCSTCHIAANAMGLSLQNVQARYLLTAGRDPLFALGVERGAAWRASFHADIMTSCHHHVYAG